MFTCKNTLQLVLRTDILTCSIQKSSSQFLLFCFITKELLTSMTHEEIVAN